MKNFRQKMDSPMPSQRALKRVYGLCYMPSLRDVQDERASLLRKWREGRFGTDLDHAAAAALNLELKSADFGAANA